MNLDGPVTWYDVPAAVRARLSLPLFKQADDGLPVLSQLADVAGWRAGPANAFWGGPRPVTNLLVGGALGSLGGYGAGRLAEEVLPERYFRPGALRRRGALVGGVLGAAPAVYQGVDSVRHTGDWRSVFDRWPAKAAAEKTGGIFDPVIAVDDFNRSVFHDPNTPLHLRAATAGLTEAASAVRGEPTVSAWDIAKIAVGAGGGLAAGLVAGKTLGLLAGITPEAQTELMRVGMWAGALRNAVPPALGLPR